MTSETNAHDVNGPLQSGTFGGPVQTVHVAIPTMQTIEPPEYLRDAIKDIWKVVVSDQLERRERQKATDTTMHLVANKLEMIDKIVWELHAETRLIRWMSGAGWVAVLALAGAMARLLGWW